MKWINPVLCTLYNDLVRVELGSQIVELPMTEHYLSDGVTMPYYQEGSVDAYGKVIHISPDGGEGDTMHVVDHRQKFAKKVWKVYRWTKTDTIAANGEYMYRFVKVAEFEDKDKALKHAKSLLSMWEAFKIKLLGDK